MWNTFGFAQVECKKAQPKEVMFPTVLANSRVAARAPNGELVFLSPSAPFRPFDAHATAPRVSDILKPDQSRHFNANDLYDAVQSECDNDDDSATLHTINAMCIYRLFLCLCLCIPFLM